MNPGLALPLPYGQNFIHAVYLEVIYASLRFQRLSVSPLIFFHSASEVSARASCASSFGAGPHALLTRRRAFTAFSAFAL